MVVVKVVVVTKVGTTVSSEDHHRQKAGEGSGAMLHPGVAHVAWCRGSSSSSDPRSSSSSSGLGDLATSLVLFKR